MTSETDKNIYQRILGVMNDISYVKKGDTKVNNQYTFVGHDAVAAALHPLMVKHGIVCLTSIIGHSQDGNRTEASIKIELINTDNSEDKVELTGFGYGIDSQDKGPGKAVSYAVKILLLKTFMLETGERDNEADLIDHVDEEETRLLAALEKHSVSVDLIKEAMAMEEYDRAFEAWNEIPDEGKKALWIAPSKSKHAPFTTNERGVFKSDKWAEARHNYTADI